MLCQIVFLLAISKSHCSTLYLFARRKVSEKLNLFSFFRQTLNFGPAVITAVIPVRLGRFYIYTFQFGHQGQVCGNLTTSACHRRRIYTESKANSRRFCLGGKIVCCTGNFWSETRSVRYCVHRCCTFPFTFVGGGG